MDNIVGKTTQFIIKLAFILSLIGMVLGWVATGLMEFSELIPTIEAFVGFSIPDLTGMSTVLTLSSIASGGALKMAGVANTINRTHLKYVNDSKKIQKQYFDNGITTIQTQLKTQQSQFNTVISQKDAELQQKEAELQMLREEKETMAAELELKVRSTETLKTNARKLKDEIGV